MNYSCSKCGEVKPKADFHTRKDRPKGVTSCCKECRRDKDRGDWIPRQQTEYKLMAQYGLSLVEYGKMHDAQGGKCAICNEGETVRSNTGYVKNLAVDHCHTTGEVRGLLCNRCNVGIGYLNDDVVRLHSAIKYLNKEKI